MSLFNSEQFGKECRTWIGQIVDDTEWKENRSGKKYEDPSEIPGWGYRYKVRIFGKHPEAQLRDVELPWADIIYPVTGGSGHASSFQTPNLRKNSFVFGLYLDGMDETQPVILGCFGNNDQTKLLFTRPPVGFIPASGLPQEQVPVYSIPTEKSKLKQPVESTGLGDSGKKEPDNQQEKDGLLESTLPISEKCAKSLDKTQIEIKRFIQRVEETQRRSQNWSYWVNTKGTELASGVFRTETIDIDVQRSAQFISGELKEFLNGIREFISELIDKEISKFYKLFFPQEEKILEKAHDGAIDLITCLFNKIIANLIKIIGDLLTNIVGKIVNAATCAIESIVSSILGQLLGLITGTLNSILGPITSIIGSAIDLAGDILGFVGQILGFFLCDEQSACPENTKWSSWGGASSSKASLDFNKIFNKTKEISEKSKKVVDPNNFDFNLDFGSVFEDTCNVGPIFCGPPTVSFSGGGGKGARGNAIISATGNILGIDIITPGSGYSQPPSVNFADACGKGKGAKAEVEMEDDKNNPGKKKVKRVKIKEPGSGYLSGFDGSRGGDGRVYATPEQIVIERQNGIFELFNPGDPFEVFDGDKVSGPFDPTSTTFLTGLPGGTGGSGGVADSIPLVAGGTEGDEVNVGGNTAIAGDLIVTVGGTGGIPLVSGGSGGSPVTIGGILLTVGGVGGTPIIVNNNQVTSNGLPVTVGGIGGLSVTAGGTGGTPVIAGTTGGTPVTSGGTGGTPVTVGGSPVTVGGTGGTPVIIGGTPVTVGGTPVTSGGTPVTVGGTGGTPVTVGGTGGTPVIIGGSPVTVGGTGGTPVIIGGTPVTVGGTPVTSGGTPVTVGGTPVTVGGTGGTPVTSGGTGGTPLTVNGRPVTSGGTGGTPVTSGGTPVTVGGTPVTVGGTGGTPVTSGGTGGTPLTVNGRPVTSGGTGGTPVTVGGTPVTVGGTGGTPVTSGGTGGTPVTVGGSSVTVGGTGGTPLTVNGRPVTVGGTGGTPVTVGGTGGTPLTVNGRPVTVNDFDSTSFGKYPVVLKLIAVEIESTGVNYSPTDTISVEPSNGAILEPVFGPFGSIIGVNLINEGDGFTERPNIVIKTETGYNALLIPIFDVSRIGDIPEELYRIPEGRKIIQVIDCVGKPR
jgi:hypothetical protein